MAEEESTQIQRNQIRGRRLKPRSVMWDHFTRETDSDGKEIARCKRCRQEYAYYGTRNLKKHYDKGCSRQEGSADAGAAEQPPQPLPSLAQDEGDMQQQQLPLLPPAPLPPSACDPSSYGGSSERESSGGPNEEASKHLARMIALGGYDASILEDHWFKSFVRSINPEFEVPSRVAIENICDDIFDEERRDLLDRLRGAPGKVNLAVGRAKTMEQEVVYVACHFIDDGWNLHKTVLHAAVTTDHFDIFDGPILGHYVWSGDDMDDNVDEVTRAYGIDDRLFMVSYEKTDKEIHARMHDWSWKEIPFNTTYVDNVLHSIARCLDEYVLRGYIYTASLDVLDLQLTRQERLELLAVLGLHYGWAYDGHWYACYCSFELLRKKGFPGEHRAYKLLITILCKVWEKIFYAIQKFSSSTRPTANLCLVELFKLREVFHTELEWFGSGDHEDIHHHTEDVKFVLSKANDTLDEAINDSYLVWSLPLAMDPRYKLEFIKSEFKKAYGSEADEAYDWSEADEDYDGSEADEDYVSDVTSMMRKRYADYVKEYSTTDGAHETELDRYLNDPLVSQAEEGFDILNWWKDHSSEYPMVARMARDALAMPTCSKLSSDQMAQVRSILRGYSKKPYGSKPYFQ